MCGNSKGKQLAAILTNTAAEDRVLRTFKLEQEKRWKEEKRLKEEKRRQEEREKRAMAQAHEEKKRSQEKWQVQLIQRLLSSDSDQRQVAPIQRMLHHDVFFNVFRYIGLLGTVSTLSCVNKFWLRMVLGDAYWRRVENVTLPGGQYSLKFSALCPRLKQLAEVSLHRTNDDTIMALVTNCKNLKELTIIEGESVSDNALFIIGSSLIPLQRLHFYRCPRLTDIGLQSLGALGSLSCLVALHISYSSEISDGGVVSVLEKCPNLQSLSLFGCAKITDVTLKTLAAFCPLLTDLNLFKCANISNHGLVALSGRCRLLQTINLASCEPNVTEDGIKALQQHCRQLTTWNLVNTRVSNDCLSFLIRLGFYVKK